MTTKLLLNELGDVSWISVEQIVNFLALTQANPTIESSSECTTSLSTGAFFVESKPGFALELHATLQAACRLCFSGARGSQAFFQANIHSPGTEVA